MHLCMHKEVGDEVVTTDTDTVQWNDFKAQGMRRYTEYFIYLSV